VTDCFVVTIDGPSGAGKSTVARRVAASLGFQYLDSGALYRAVALAAIESNVEFGDPVALNRLLGGLRIQLGANGSVLLNGRDVAGLIRTEQVSQAASKVSSLDAVRAALIDLQRGAVAPPGSVVEGRDMGTVVFPDAGLKIFLDADVDERARRRTLELQGRGQNAVLEDVRAEMVERDRRDRTRVVAPLRPAEDAVLLDSTRLTISQVVETIAGEARRRGAGN
jgi:cytidylate kinase